MKMKKLVSVLTAGLVAISMAIPAFAAEGTGFVPSATLDTSPEVKDGTVITIDGTDYPFAEFSESGVAVVVTSYANKDDAHADIASALEGAYADLAADGTINFVDDAAKAAYDAAVKKAADAGNKLVVSDLFDVSVLKDNVVTPPNGVTLKLAVANADEIALVMHKTGDKWEVVDYTNNGDGTVTMTLDSLSPIALFVEAAADTPAPDDSSSEGDDPSTGDDSSESDQPTTGDSNTGLIIAIIAMIGVVAGIVVYPRAKKNN